VGFCFKYIEEEEEEDKNMYSETLFLAPPGFSFHSFNLLFEN